jgi:hypothetical protein
MDQQEWSRLHSPADAYRGYSAARIADDLRMTRCATARCPRSGPEAANRLRCAVRRWRGKRSPPQRGWSQTRFQFSASGSRVTLRKISHRNKARKWINSVALSRGTFLCFFQYRIGRWCLLRRRQILEKKIHLVGWSALVKIRSALVIDRWLRRRQ